MDRERAETFLRLLAEAELRRAVTVPAAGMPGRRCPAGLALAAQALTAVGAVDSGVARQIQADAGLAIAARLQLAARDTGPERIRLAPKRATWRVVPVGQVIKPRDSGLADELIVMAYVQSAGGGRFLMAEWPCGPFAAVAADDRGTSYQVRWRGEMAPRELELHPCPAHQIRWLDLTAAPGQPAVRIDLARQLPAPDITVTPQSHSAGELLLDVVATRILTTTALVAQGNRGQPAASTVPRALIDGLGHVVAALHAAGALPPGSPVPRQLAGLCATLGITGHGITAPTAGDLPERWHSMLVPGRPAQTPQVPGIRAVTAAELPALDGATIAIAGLHHGERGTIMALLATGVTLEDDWPYARGARPLPVLSIRDNHGRWHATRLDSLSPWGDHGTNPWTDTRMVTLWLKIIPPLDPGTTWIEISATGRSAEARTTLTVNPQ